MVSLNKLGFVVVTSALCMGPVSFAVADEVVTRSTTTITSDADAVGRPPMVGDVVRDGTDCSKTKVTKTDEATGDTMTKTKTSCD